MANEEEVDADDEKKKGGLVKILLLALIGILVITMSVGGTLFLTGFFDERPVQFDENGNVIALEVEDENVENEADISQIYSEMERKFTVNLTGSRQFFQFSVGFMTNNDPDTVTNVYIHELAIRSAIILEVSTYSKDQLATAADKQKVADMIKVRMNQVLIDTENTAGIEEVFFTEFLIQ
jgi:flagellar FliL protein|tara:strand:+ start:6169 stop:6708 length:540 start_codon:yes stop_codon:yes gene_type:complete